MKIYFTALMLFINVCLVAQDFQAVDRVLIEKSIKDSSLPTYYPRLLSRMKAGDTTFTNDEFRLIYYGYVFQPGYSPYGDDKSTEIRAALKDNKFELVNKYCDEVISTNPVSLKNYYYKMVALINLNKQDSTFYAVRRHYWGLLDAIASSGNGQTCKTALKVISVSDEYEIMYRYFEIQQVESQALQTPCDKMTVKPSDIYPGNTIFFDVSESFAAMKKMFKK